MQLKFFNKPSSPGYSGPILSSYSHALLFFSTSFASLTFFPFIIIITTSKAELVFIYSRKRGLQRLPSPSQRRFAGIPRDFSSLNKPTRFLAEGLADYGWGDICQRGIAKTPWVSYFLDDGELKREVDIYIFSPFPFLSFPFLLAFPSQSVTEGLMDAPAPPKTSLGSQAHQAGKGFGLNLSRGVLGQQQVPLNSPNRWGCSKQAAFVPHKYSLPVKCYKKRPICCLVISIFYLGSPIHI